MKNKGLGIAAFIAVIGLLLPGCATTTTNTQSNVAMGADVLAGKIREASDYLNTRIPNGSKVAFINISGGYPDLAEYILGDLSRHGVNDGVFSVVDRAQLEAVRSELHFNMSGEVSDQSAQAIGQMLGAQTIVSGSVRRIGNLYRLEVKAIEVQTASIQGQQVWDIPHGMTIAALTTNTGGGTAAAAPAGGRTQPAAAGGTAAPAAAPAAPAAAAPVQVLKNGTYTLNPRPRVRQAGGQWEDMWVTKVEVENRFITFYFDDRATGAGSGQIRHGLTDWHHSHVTLYNLDRPSVFVKGSGTTDNGNSNHLVSLIFPRLDAKRFKMETLAYGRDKAFEEIILGEPDE